MFADRNLRQDLTAVALAALVVFLGLALLTYNPADPVDQASGVLARWYRADVLVYPPSESITNACGRWGALASDALYNAFGLGALYLVGSLGVLAVTLLRRKEVDAFLVRALGWCASLVGVATLAYQVLPSWTPGPVVGSGGYVGALVGGVLENHFALLGGMILASSVVVGGLMLASDRLFLTVVRAAWQGARWVLGGSFGHIAPQLVQRFRVEQAQSRRRKAQRDRDIAAAHADDEWYDDQDERDEDARELRERNDERAAAGRRRSTSDLDAAEASGLPVKVKNRGTAVAALAEKAAAPKLAPDTAKSGEARGAKNSPAAPSTPLAPVPATTLAVAAKPAAEPTAEESDPQYRIKKLSDRSEARAQVRAALEQLSEQGDGEPYELPSLDLLVQGEAFQYDQQEKEVRRKAKTLERTFADFGFKVKVVEIETGPVIAQYEVELEAGLRLSKITGLADDLAIALRVPSVRIVAPIPGKNTVGIEVPNEDRQVVRLREVIEETNGKIKKMRIPLFLGKDVSGNALTADLSSLPHLLIAGRTGTGKSVCLNAIISSILMTRRPDEVRLLMIDPKMVELSGYGRLPHLMHPVVTDMRKAEAILAWAVEKMEERYALLARAGVRHISSYNQLGEAELVARLQPEDEEASKAIPRHLPFIVIVADEIADMMMTAGKEVEQHIIRLAQKSRAVGIHLILATQKPTVDVITGLIKSNLPARISFQVASRTDSRVVLDEMGADKLLGNGDMLFLWPGTSTLLRGQGTYLGDDEINRIVDHCSRGRPQQFVSELMNMKVEKPGEPAGPEAFKKRDELYESAIEVVIREGRGSVSLLQRALGVGYGRAARLIDFMAEDGIVGTYAGSQAREVLITMADWERMQGLEPSEETPAAKPSAGLIASSPPSSGSSGGGAGGGAKRRPNRIMPEEHDAPFDGDDESPTSAANSSSRSSRHTIPLGSRDDESDELDVDFDDRHERDAETA